MITIQNVLKCLVLTAALALITMLGLLAVNWEVARSEKLKKHFKKSLQPSKPEYKVKDSVIIW